MNQTIINNEETQSNQEDTELLRARAAADELGVKYHHANKAEAIWKKIDEFKAEAEIDSMLNEETSSAPEEPALDVAAQEDDEFDPMRHWEDFDLDSAERASMIKGLNIDFSHITEMPENKKRFRFAGVHCFPKGNIERHEKKGWRLWEEAGSHSRYLDLDESESKNNYVSVPVGSHAEGVQKLFLMYMPHEIYDRTIGAAHKKRADDQLSIVKDPKIGEEEIINADTGLAKTVKSGTSLSIVNEEADTGDE